VRASEDSLGGLLAAAIILIAASGAYSLGILILLWDLLR
jgi:hypothetical protein